MRVVVGLAVAVFGYGTVVHLVQLALMVNGPYPSAPAWLVTYFVSLTVLDPASAALLALRRRAGLVLGCLVLLTDAAANGYANYVLDPSAGLTLGRLGQAIVTILAVTLLLVAPRIRPWLIPLEDTVDT